MRFVVAVLCRKQFSFICCCCIFIAAMLALQAQQKCVFDRPKAATLLNYIATPAAGPLNEPLFGGLVLRQYHMHLVPWTMYVLLAYIAY